ncbi:MAG: 4-alpha-glucanotransferase [Oscillospiraceae bacterium]
MSIFYSITLILHHICDNIITESINFDKLILKNITEKELKQMLNALRSSGVLFNISSLPGPFGVGVFGKEALDFIDMISDMGFKYWQVLPIGPIDEANSPYKSSSAFAGSLLYIDPRSLKSMGLVSQDEVDNCLCHSDERKANYTFAAEKRLALLRIAYSRIDQQMRSSIDNFATQNTWVESYALFCAIKVNQGGTPWWEWDFGYDDYEFCKRQYFKFIPSINFYKFIQYIFYLQWSIVKNYANFKGIKLIADMPFYLALDSADVWSNTYNFQIDEETLKPNGFAGVPPDYFSDDGQLWGNPLYNWKAMEDDGYSWWISRFKFLSQRFDITRIDHFRAFSSYWAVDPDSETAKNGKWLDGPGQKFFSILDNTLPGINLIAEDLGYVGEDVRELLKSAEIPGMRVMQFGLEDIKDSPHLPHNYSFNTVSYIGTHDSDTFVGFINNLPPEKKQFALDYCGFRQSSTDDTVNNLLYCKSAIEALWRSNSFLTVLTIQDMCAMNTDARLNKPGTKSGNWLFRCTQDELDSIDREYFKKINKVFKR